MNFSAEETGFIRASGLACDGTAQSLIANYGRTIVFVARPGDAFIIIGIITGVEVRIGHGLPKIRLEISNKELAGNQIKCLEYQSGPNWLLVGEYTYYIPGMLSISF
ncbi:MAG: hypothetical protein ACOZBH_04935 [Patescibacteria group bacterium]